MKPPLSFAAPVLLLVLMWLGQTRPADCCAAQEPPPKTDSGGDVEILTRGPIHEAFAEQVGRDPGPGALAPKPPPPDIEEIPPAFKPEGDDVVWIPGYWAWDDERQDFIWVSGVWRSPPPGCQWTPGYWRRTAEGYRWVSGFWANTEIGELPYRAPPPPSLEQGPSSIAPSPTHFWIPGCWVPLDAAYRWRPGYWHPYQESWVWIPARYIWTPCGCLYVDGYWDYCILLRGRLFAPVCFPYEVYRPPGYCYWPSCVIDSVVLSLHLFVRPGYHHYYFGDYYGPACLERQIYPCFEFHSRGRGYEPFYVYNDVYFRLRGVDYGRRIHDWHRYLCDHERDRPPRTLHDQAHYAPARGGPSSADLRHTLIGRPLSDAAPAEGLGRRWTALAAEQRHAVENNREQLQRSRLHRAQVEAIASSKGPGAKVNTALDTPPRRTLKLAALLDQSAPQGKTQSPAPANHTPVGRAKHGLSDRSESDRTPGLRPRHSASDRSDTSDTSDRSDRSDPSGPRTGRAKHRLSDVSDRSDVSDVSDRREPGMGPAGRRSPQRALGPPGMIFPENTGGLSRAAASGSDSANSSPAASRFERMFAHPGANSADRAGFTERRPVDRFSAERRPVDRFSAERRPVDRFSAERSPVDRFSAERSPVDRFSAERRPVDRFSTEKRPVDRFSAERSPVDRLSAERSPVTRFQSADQPEAGRWLRRALGPTEARSWDRTGASGGDTARGSSLAPPSAIGRVMGDVFRSQGARPPAGARDAPGAIMDRFPAADSARDGRFFGPSSGGPINRSPPPGRQDASVRSVESPRSAPPPARFQPGSSGDGGREGGRRGRR